MSRRNRAKRASHADGGAAWISYSDMMAALLLLFVLVLCYCMFQYFSMLDTKTAELDEQAALLASQQTTLDSQQLALAAQQTALDEQEKELSASRLQLSAQQTRLDEQTAVLAQQQSALDAASLTLSQKEDELADANAALAVQEGQLEQTALLLAAKQTELDESSALLAAKQTELDQSSALLASQQNELDQAAALLASQQARLDDLVGVKTRIVRELTSALGQAKIKASVDPNTGDIMLESAVFFEYGKNELTPSGQAFLNRFIPVYMGVLLQDEYSDYLGEIIIEGHTDSSGTYQSNLKLSQQRALSVANFCLDMKGLTRAEREKLQSILTATGKSSSNLIYDETGVEDADASRRVEFKFRLRDTEMIDEIREILGG